MEGSRHEHYMKLALQLAGRAVGQTAPNPLVGAVIVKGTRVVGTGYHRGAGRPHAETEALRRAGPTARGGTLYVTLEPCNHYGRTPPCCDAIIAAGLKHVVVGMQDPNPITNGRGIARLRHSGIRVTHGVLARPAQAMNEPFRKAMLQGLPLVIGKIAQSVDGKIATTSGASRWMTSATARRMVHQWRSRVDALVVGIRTVERDDPLLNVRGARQRLHRPLKVIVDTHLRLSPRARCLSEASPAPTIVATTRQGASQQGKRAALARRGVEILTVPAWRGRVRLTALCRQLVHRGVHSLLIEGGGELLAGALAERLVDRMRVFIAPILIGGRQAPSTIGGVGIRRLSQAIRLDDLRVRRVGPDLCLEARVVYPHSRINFQQRGTRNKGQGTRQ